VLAPGVSTFLAMTRACSRFTVNKGLMRLSVSSKARGLIPQWVSHPDARARAVGVREGEEVSAIREKLQAINDVGSG
jgi:hypothetical protein